HVRPHRRPVWRAPHPAWAPPSVRVARRPSLRPKDPVPAREQQLAAPQPPPPPQATGKKLAPRSSYNFPVTNTHRPPALVAHPIKSLDAIEVSEARIGPNGGLEHDRAWALYA